MSVSSRWTSMRPGVLTILDRLIVRYSKGSEHRLKTYALMSSCSCCSVDVFHSVLHGTVEKGVQRAAHLEHLMVTCGVSPASPLYRVLSDPGDPKPVAGMEEDADVVHVVAFGPGALLAEGFVDRYEPLPESQECTVSWTHCFCIEDSLNHTRREKAPPTVVSTNSSASGHRQGETKE